MPELEHGKTSALTALGVLSVVLGAFWLIASVWSGLHIEAHQQEVAHYERYGIPQILTGFGVTGAYIDAAMNFVLAGALFAAGVGLLRLRRWGATLARGYAFARIVASAVSAVFALVAPIASRPGPAELETFQPLQPQTVEFLGTRFMPVVWTEIVAGFLLSTVFAVILLCLLSRKEHKDALS